MLITQGDRLLLQSTVKQREVRLTLKTWTVCDSDVTTTVLSNLRFLLFTLLQVPRGLFWIVRVREHVEFCDIALQCSSCAVQSWKRSARSANKDGSAGWGWSVSFLEMEDCLLKRAGAVIEKSKKVTKGSQQSCIYTFDNSLSLPWMYFFKNPTQGTWWKVWFVKSIHICHKLK